MKSRLVLIVYLASLLPLAWGQDLQVAPITYSTPAISASKALDAISRLTNQKLKIEPPLDTEPLILRLQGVMPKDALAWIAQVLHGAWSNDGYVKTLRRTKYQVDVLRISDATARTRLIQAALSTRAQAARAPYWTEQAAAQAKAGGIATANRLLIDRVLAALNASELAKAPWPNHIVYASRPRAMQLPLRLTPAEVNAVINEQNAWTVALQSPPSQRRLIDLKRARILVVCSEDGSYLPAWISVKIVNGSGGVYVKGESKFPSVPAASLDAPVELSPDVKSVELGADSIDFLHCLWSPAKQQPGSSLLARLSQPEEHDPLGLVISEGLLNIAEQGHYNLVASPPDATLFDPVWITVGSNPADFLAACSRTCHTEIQGQTLLMSPTAPLRAAGHRTNRAALGTYLGTLSHDGYSSTNAEVAFAQPNPGADLQLAKRWAEWVHPGCHPFLGSSMDILAFYGSLAVAQRKTLMGGIALKLDDLSSTQKALLTPLIVNAPGDVYLGRSPEKSVFKPGADITELSDQGYNGDLSFTMTAGTEQDMWLQGADPFGRYVSEVMPVVEAPERSRAGGALQSENSMVNTANALRFEFQVTPDIKIVQTIREFPHPFAKAPVFKDPPMPLKTATRPAKSNSKKS